MKLPFQCADPACENFQYLEDLATAYWYSEVLFAALELGVFTCLDPNGCDLDTLARSAACSEDPLKRLLNALKRLELVDTACGKWFNSQAAGKYLVSGKPAYLGDFLLYRRYMQPQWRKLTQQVSRNPDRFIPRQAPDMDYEARTLDYVRAMDALCRQKSDEINTCLDPRGWDPPILDIGGGAGTLSRVLIGSKPGGRVVLFELPEVIRAAKILYPDDDDWECFTILTGDFRSHPFENPVRPGMVIMSNFLHAYSPTEAQELLCKALTLLDPEGVALIHDYFPDRLGPYPQKGALYDLNMMLNTFNGVCHLGSRILSWLNAAGFSRIQVLDLTTDSTIIAARKANVARPALKPCDDWPHQAIKFGFRKAVWVASDAVATAPWVRQKCQHGCKSFGKNLQCPPRGLSIEETRNLLQSYHRILLVEGEPPSVNFHRRLLDLERAAFLAGHHKAFVLGAGPCPVCDVCPDNGNCRHPEHARPSMEGCGIDVYKTVQDAGITLKPVLRKNQYIKYFGLLLLE